jgi:hypothetical protein
VVWTTSRPIGPFFDGQPWSQISEALPPGEPLTRRRHFHGVGRYPGTLQHVAAELNCEGTDYLMLPDAAPNAAVAPALISVRQILSQSPGPLTCQELLAHWPESEPPRTDSLSRALTRGCELGILVRTGAGTRAESFRYALALGPPAGDRITENSPNTGGTQDVRNNR